MRKIVTSTFVFENWMVRPVGTVVQCVSRKLAGGSGTFLRDAGAQFAERREGFPAAVVRRVRDPVGPLLRGSSLRTEFRFEKKVLQ